ncbi:flavodoxin family protein [bacterium]|nr:flavodoxin family protein [bacterium]
MPKVLGISGSPRIQGNSHILLKKALEGVRSQGWETQEMVLNELTFVPCQEEEYEQVDESGLSVIQDDMQKVYAQVEESSAVIISSPIFFGTLSAQTKMMIDRFQCVWISKYKGKSSMFTQPKPGGFICVEASQREDFLKNAQSIIKNFFKTINLRYVHELLLKGIDKKAEVRNHPEYLSGAYQMGIRMTSGLPSK